MSEEPKTQALTKSALKGFLWIFSGMASHSVLNLIVLSIIARLLTPVEFGIVGAALIVVGFSQIFSQLSVGPAIVQLRDLNIKHIHAGFSLSLFMSCLVGLAIVLIAPFIAVFFKIPNLRPVVQIFALIFPISGISVTSQALLQRERQFKKLAIIEFIGYSLGFGILGIILALSGLGVWALAFAYIGQATIKTLLLLSLKREVFGFVIRGPEIFQILSFGLGVSLNQIASFIANQADNLVVGRWLGPWALGIYSRAYQFLVSPAILFGSAIDMVLFPTMSVVQSDTSRLARAYIMAVSIVAMLAMPFSGLLIILAPEIVYVLLGENWLAVVLPFQILALVLVFRASYKISDSLVRAKGAVYQNAWRTWIYAGAVFGGTWIGHFWGLKGVAIGVDIAIVLHFLLMVDLSIRIIGASRLEYLLIHLRYLTIAIIVSGGVWACKFLLKPLGLHESLILIVGFAAFGLMYFLIYLIYPKIFGLEGVFIKNIIKSKFTALFFSHTDSSN